VERGVEEYLSKYVLYFWKPFALRSFILVQLDSKTMAFPNKMSLFERQRKG
jgi:hypothetical protein